MQFQVNASGIISQKSDGLLYIQPAQITSDFTLIHILGH
jgi:hypothetical protein